MHSLSYKLLTSAAAILLSVAALSAQSFQSASDKASQDLNVALKELSELRAEIGNEKIPMIRELTKLEDEVRQKGSELDRLRRLRDNKDIGLDRLRVQVEALEEQNEYAASLLDEFVRSFESRIHFAETQVYKEATKEARLAPDDPNLTQAERFKAQIDAIGVAVDRLENLVGGYTFDGLALAPDGEILEGKFTPFGPSVYFASKDGTLEGIAITQLNAAEAAIAVPSGNFNEDIRKFVETGEGEIPIDATLGKAQLIDQQRDTLMEHVAKGGAVGYVIIGLGIVCMLIGLFKFAEITGVKTPAPEAVQNVLSKITENDLDNARTEASGINGVGGELIRTGLEHIDDKRGTMEEILYERILAVRPKLERFLPFMALTAAAAPLLGLLGTVTGMISTFNLITIFGTGDAGNLASGISQALVTTELGLIVAIPSLILHGLLSRMARQKLGDMEQAAIGFVNGVIGTRQKDA